MSHWKRTLRGLCAVLIVMGSHALLAQTRKLDVDFSKTIGTIRPLNGVNGGPIVARGAFDLSAQFKELGIRRVRLHDVPWVYENVIDINYIFPRFEADANDPANYDFSLSDYYIDSIRAIGADMTFRLGYSAEWKFHPRLHNAPPKDFAKWALICANIVRHYNQGWANGHHYGIKYWEIWNEPDIKNFWTGSVEDYIRLYDMTARTLKAVDPTLKVGGPGLAAGWEFLEAMVRYCAAHSTPLDFVSWHFYAREPYMLVVLSEKVKHILNNAGFRDTESILNEWNYFPGDWDSQENDANYRKNLFENQTGGIAGAVFVASAFIYLQDSSVTAADYYQGTTSFWGGLFDAFGVPRKPFYTFKAFRTLLETPRRVAASGSDQKELAVIAGLSDDRSQASVLISNFSTQPKKYDLILRGLDWKQPAVIENYVIDSDSDLALQTRGTFAAGDQTISGEMEPMSVCLVRLRAGR